MTHSKTIKRRVVDFQSPQFGDVLENNQLLNHHEERKSNEDQPPNKNPTSQNSIVNPQRKSISTNYIPDRKSIEENPQRYFLTAFSKINGNIAKINNSNGDNKVKKEIELHQKDKFKLPPSKIK